MADDYTKMMQEMSTAHDKSRQQDEMAKEERKNASDPVPKRSRHVAERKEENGQPTSNSRNYNGARGGRGQSSRGYAAARADDGYRREEGADRRGGSYNPRGRGGRTWNNDQAGEDSYQIRTRGTRGAGARGAGGPRGSRGGPRGGPRGGTRGNGYEPRGRGGGRGRGGRPDYVESQEVEYQSNPEDSDGDVSSEQEALTREEHNYLERKYTGCKEQLKNIVNEIQIKQKCIDLEFNEEDFDEWVRSLGTTDSRVAGVKEFEWNDTVTKGEKLYDRKKKLQEGKRQKAKERVESERATARAAAAEKKKETDAKRKEERAKSQAAKLIEEEAKEAQERAEREAKGEAEPINEVVPTIIQDADSGEKEEAPPKSRKNKGVAKEMVYQKKNRNEKDSSFQVKNGSKTNVYRKKEPVEQLVETTEEVAAEQFEGEKKLDEYNDEENYNEEDAYANDQQEENHATPGQFEQTRRQSDDESSDLLRQAADHNQKDEQREHEERQKAEQEKHKHEKEQAERRRKEETVKRQQAHEANKAREERMRREAEEKADAEKREQETREREAEKEKAAEEGRRAQAQKKAAEAASEQAQQAVPNPFSHHPYMMPMALGTPAAGAQTGDKADSTAQQQQMLPLDQQQYYYQAMAAHQQMAHQYQAMLTHQFALQQQLLSQGSVGNPNNKSSQGPATNNGAAGLQNPLAAQNPYAAMAGMPTGFPMMPPMSAGMPGMMPPGAVGDPSQNPMMQQQFMPMPGCFPMPMMYPNQQVPHPQQPGFQSKNDEK